MSYQEIFSTQIIDQLTKDDWQAIGIYEDFQQAILGILIREPATIEELQKHLLGILSKGDHHLLSLVLEQLLYLMMQSDILYLINSSQKYQLSRSTKEKLAVHLNLKPEEQQITKKPTDKVIGRLSSIAGEIVQPLTTKGKTVSPIKSTTTLEPQQPKVTGLRLNKVIIHLSDFAYPLDVLAQRTRMHDVELLQLLEVMKVNGFVKQKELNYELDWRGFDFYRMADSERLNLLKAVAQRINAEK
jgi:hypothetical protein